MRILLLGKRGQLGWELNRTLAPLGETFCFDFPDIDMTSAESIFQAVQKIKPDLIVNATAYTDVDRAESESDIAFTVNGIGPGVLAEEAQKINATLLHYSTDYVFDGKKGVPYIEADSTNPLNIYGKSKLFGEQNIRQTGCAWIILRTSWVYSLRTDNFTTKVLRWSRQHKTLKIVDDQISNPTWARMLAEITAQLLAMGGKNLHSWFEEHQGIYHLASSGKASRLQWAQAILDLDPDRQNQIAEEILPARTIDFPNPAARPHFSALNSTLFENTFGLRMPDWEVSLRLALQIE